MKKLLFIGDRAGVCREIQHLTGVSLVAVMALKDSYLHADLVADQKQCLVFLPTAKDLVISSIQDTEFDILVSNGCPFILPVSRLRRSHQLFLNVHPAFLPEGRGRHPVNGALLQGATFIGATLHYMDDGVDTGNILHQERIEITDDLDLALLYRIVFELEVRVFREGMRKLAAADYSLLGQAHSGKGSYYSRLPEHQQVDIAHIPDEDILRRVRAFGIRSQGVIFNTNSGDIRVFEAERITNPYLHQQYGASLAGTVLLRYEDRLLVKSRDGIIKIKSFLSINEANS